VVFEQAASSRKKINKTLAFMFAEYLNAL